MSLRLLRRKSLCRATSNIGYLRDVLTRLPDQPKVHLADLLPDRWAPPKAADATSGTASPNVAESVD
jgi:hypothetical protein